MTAAPPATGPLVPAPRTPQQRRTLALACASTLLVLITFVTPLGTLGRTAADLGAGASAQAWLLSAMSVGLAAALLTAGCLADDLGRRRVFVAGLALLGAGAVVCAVSSSSLSFIGGRLVQGVGGAAVLACALGLVGHAFAAGPERMRATGLWGASVGAGTGVGGLVSVAVDPGDRWRGTYVVVALAAVALAVLGRALLVESRSDRPRRPDPAGAVLLAGGLSALLAALVEGRSGLDRPLVLGLAVLGVLLLVGFVAVEQRVSDPALDLALLRRPAFAAATLGALVTGLGCIGLFSFLPTVLQRGLGTGLLTAVLVIALWAAVSAVTALQVRRLPASLSGRTRLVAGLLGVAAGELMLLGLTEGSTPWRLVPGVVVVGVAYGLLNATLGREAVASVPADRTSTGSGANNTARYVGSAVGVSVVVVLATRGDDLLAGWTAAVLVTATTCVLGALAVLACRPRGAPGLP